MAYNHHHIYLEHLAHDHNSSLLYIVQGSPLPSMLSQTDLGIGNHCYQHCGGGEETASSVPTNCDDDCSFYTPVILKSVSYGDTCGELVVPNLRPWFTFLMPGIDLFTCFLLRSSMTSECCLSAVKASFSCSVCRSVRCSLIASNTLGSIPGDWVTTAPVKAGLFCRAIMPSSRLIPSICSLLFKAMFLISARATKS